MRLVRLTRRFLASKNAHAPAGTPAARAVARVVAELADELRPLPGPHRDERLDPVGVYPARPIPSAGLSVLYLVAADGSVILVAVNRTT